MRKLLLISLGFLALLCAPIAAHASEGQIREITVLADESLQIPLIELARLHTERTNTAVNLWFASAAGMVDAIRDGADADIVITADTEALQTLEYLGQLDVYATQSIASCPLVIAVRSDERATERNVTLDLMGLKPREGETLSLVTITSDDRPESKMAMKALSASEWLKDRKLNLIGASDAREAKKLMAEHNAPALLLATDVFSNRTLKVARRFPDSVVPPAVFKAAVLAGERMEESRQFIDSIHTPDYRLSLERYGLGKATTPTP